jgi:hypothetical protein
MMVAISGIKAAHVRSIYSRPTNQGTRRTNMRDNESVYLMPTCVWRAFLRAHLHVALC